MARGKKLPRTKEEKVAVRLTDLVNDYDLDLEETGRYLARVASMVSYNRIIEIVEVAEIEKASKHHNGHNPNPIFQ